jgi:general stress protein 26
MLSNCGRISDWCRASIALVLAVAVMTSGRARAGELPAAVTQALRSSSYIYIATERSDGALSSIKPVWFYYEGGDELFFTTAPSSWKARRIARGSPLHIWVGDKSGPRLLGRAREVTDTEQIDRMGRAYADKYWLAWLGFFKPRSGRVAEGKTKAYLVRLEASR